MKPRHVRIVEVSPRDGLQNEKNILDVDTKAQLIARLASHGFRTIESGSFVSPRVKQMANTQDVLLHPAVREASSSSTMQFLVPNKKGLDSFLRTVEQGYGNERHPPTFEVSIFAAATESFSQANLNASINDSLDRLAQVAGESIAKGFRVRGYVSCAAGCPIEGRVDSQRVRQVSKALHDMGCYEISLGDTIGVGTPHVMEKVLSAVNKDVPIEAIAAHCHDTYGSAIANVLHMVRLGVTTIDASVAGLGGCPFAKGASGNVATEDVVYALAMEGHSTDLIPQLRSGAEQRQAIVDALLPLAQTGQWISDYLRRPNSSNVGKAVLTSARLGSEA